MLFSLRSILAVTFLTSLAPLSVVGAPLSQVEDGIERRALPAGHQVALHDHHNNVVGHHTLGAPLLHPGSTATVHNVVGRPDLIAKVFHPGVASPRVQKAERDNLHQVGEYRGAENTGGHHVIFAQKHSGRTLQNTQAWRTAHANGDTAKKEQLKAQAAALTRNQNANHAEFHGIVHTDTNHGNVLYHEHNGHLTDARFADWGLAKPTGRLPNGQFDSSTMAAIHRSGSKAVHGVSR